MHDSSNNGFWRGPDCRSKSDRGSKLAAFGYLVDQARNQNAGGGRMNWVTAGRKIAEVSETEVASAAVARTGADATG